MLDIQVNDPLNVLFIREKSFEISSMNSKNTTVFDKLASDKSTYGTTFLNAVIIIPEGDTIKVVLDASHLTSTLIKFMNPSQALAPPLTTANKRYFRQSK